VNSGHGEKDTFAGTERGHRGVGLAVAIVPEALNRFTERALASRRCAFGFANPVL
jgi:hypothetical protein